ncbi:hypothetical protein SCOR_10620 [Sulfidibacter corallicola]|uniref:Uncharacterized protein n=1 Tax=Sulfidibacter corallicola TaxID=2818388 RepID=A0A8A4TEZ9_SULCO|nr:hypothetical protein [Sulfidibacter corallicola]QTD48213.1 hypothetical protein J3U87_21720 [Sulfidibacter corallicola]
MWSFHLFTTSPAPRSHTALAGGIHWVRIIPAGAGAVLDDTSIAFLFHGHEFL